MGQINGNGNGAIGAITGLEERNIIFGKWALG